MKVKDGVSLFGLQVEMRVVLKEMDEIHKDVSSTMYITSTTEGIHSPGSYHPYGYAIDFGFGYMAISAEHNIAARIRRVLPEYYDVVLEEDHIHIEFDVIKAEKLGLRKNY